MLVGVKPNYDCNGNLKFPSWRDRGQDTDIIVPVRETSGNQLRFIGSSSECAPAGARLKISVENTTRGWGGLSPTNRDGNANFLKDG